LSSPAGSGTLRLMQRSGVIVLMLVVGCGSSIPATSGDADPCTTDAWITFEEVTLTVSPTSAAFGTLAVGAQSAPSTFVVSNIRCPMVQLAGPRIDASNDFTIVGTTCGPPLPYLGTCEVQVVFRPSSPGDKMGRLVVAVASDPRASFAVVLFGTGAPPDGGSDAAPPGDGGVDGVADASTDAAGGLDVLPSGDYRSGDFTMQPSLHDFGPAAVLAGFSMPATFTVTNGFGVEEGPLTVSLSGAGAADFTITDDQCSARVVRPDAICTVSVRFRPQHLGGTSAVLGVGSGGVVARAQLIGTGIDGKLVVTPTSHTFGMVPVGMSSSARFTVIGTGRVTLAFVGMNAAEFTAKGDPACDLPLDPSTACGVTVTFSSVSPGPKSAILVVTDPAGGSVSANLTGSGI
jgi:hypothetical protein